MTFLSFLMADDGHRHPFKETDAADDGLVVGETPVTVQLDEIVDQACDVVRGRGSLMPGQSNDFNRRSGKAFVMNMGDLVFEFLDDRGQLFGVAGAHHLLDVLNRIADPVQFFLGFLIGHGFLLPQYGRIW